MLCNKIRTLDWQSYLLNQPKGKGDVLMSEYEYYYNLIIDRLKKVNEKQIKALYYIIDGFLGNS